LYQEKSGNPGGIVSAWAVRSNPARGKCQKYYQLKNGEKSAKEKYHNIDLKEKRQFFRRTLVKIVKK
jgi:hypothetical protein